MKENKYSTISKKQKGFTLIELMIVVLIIGILSGIMLAVINIPGIQSKARDARRIGDIKKLQTALELYFSDYRGYPLITEWINVQEFASVPEAPTYINRVPSDPKEGENTPAGVSCFNGTSEYGYYFISNAAVAGATLSGKYVIGAILEVPKAATDGDLCKNLGNCTGGAITCDCGGNYCYGVENPL